MDCPLPSGIFALALARVHSRLEAAIEPPLLCKSGKVGTDSGRTPGEVGSAQRRRFGHDRSIDRAREDGFELIEKSLAGQWVIGWARGDDERWSCYLEER